MKILLVTGKRRYYYYYAVGIIWEYYLNLYKPSQFNSEKRWEEKYG